MSWRPDIAKHEGSRAILDSIFFGTFRNSFLIFLLQQGLNFVAIRPCILFPEWLHVSLFDLCSSQKFDCLLFFFVKAVVPGLFIPVVFYHPFFHR